MGLLHRLVELMADKRTSLIKTSMLCWQILQDKATDEGGLREAFKWQKQAKLEETIK